MKTLKNNWRQKSIENLEKDYWGQPPKDATTLVDRVHRLRTIQIEQLTPGDIRLLIGQNVGLKFLIPVALDLLREDLFMDTDFYNGDLLKYVMRVDNDFWDANNELNEELNDLLKSYSDADKQKFKEGKFDEWT